MSEPPPTAHSGPNVDAPPRLPVSISLWARIKEHKVLQWSLAYLGAAWRRELRVAGGRATWL
jgi:hypothetical protein